MGPVNAGLLVATALQRVDVSAGVQPRDTPKAALATVRGVCCGAATTKTPSTTCWTSAQRGTSSSGGCTLRCAGPASGMATPLSAQVPSAAIPSCSERARRVRRQHSSQCTERSGSRRSAPSMACSRASASTTPTSQPMTHLPEPQYYCGALSPLTTTPRRRGVDTPYDRSPSATSPTNGAGSSARRATQSSACSEGSSQRPSG